MCMSKRNDSVCEAVSACGGGVKACGDWSKWYHDTPWVLMPRRMGASGLRSQYHEREHMT